MTKATRSSLFEIRDKPRLSDVSRAQVKSLNAKTISNNGHNLNRLIAITTLLLD